MESLVSTEWLANELGASDLRIVDASYHLPAAGRDAQAEYQGGHIPGAVFMDLADLVDTNAPVDNTLPPAEKFASRMQSLGLGDGSRIVVYDDSAVKSAARAWFMAAVQLARRWSASSRGRVLAAPALLPVIPIPSSASIARSKLAGGSVHQRRPQ